MKKEIAEMLSIALTSGYYKQCYGRLRDRDNGCFCVLGVLCDLHSRATKQEWDGNSYLEQSHVLPKEVLDWCQINKEDHTRLIIWNDNCVSFPSLAKIVDTMISS